MMSAFKRIGLFLVVNFLVVITISLVLNLLGVQPYLNRNGIDVKSLAIFCLIWGMAGSLISLFLSKTMAKFSMGVRVIPTATTHPQERRLLEMVAKLSRQAGLPAVPEVGIYSSPEVNAFATGATKRSSLVAVSSGLLQRMEEGEIEGVLGHEIAHIANGDMVTMTLLQGIVNAFVMFLARVLAFVVTRAASKDDRVELGVGYTLFVVLFEFFFMFLGMLVIAWYSRRREFRADAGGASLTGREKMVKALQKLQQVMKIQDPKMAESSFKAFKISTSKGWFRLFATHPPLEERIEHLLEIPLR